MELPQSIDTPLALIGAAHFSISLGMNFARYSGVRRSDGMTLMPRPFSRSRTAGVSTASFIASLRRRTITSGAPLGSRKTNVAEASKLVSPSSCAVGRSGSTNVRSRVSVAKALTILPSICGSAVVVTSHR